MEYLTGKNKEQFEKWYMKEYGLFCVMLPDKKGKEHTLDINYTSFFRLNFKMQIGVLLEYYDSLEINVKVFKINEYFDGRVNGVNINQFSFRNSTRIEAYKAAFIKANEIVNDQR